MHAEGELPFRVHMRARGILQSKAEVGRHHVEIPPPYRVVDNLYAQRRVGLYRCMYILHGLIR